MLLCAAALVAVAFAVPAVASASNWKKNGTELSGGYIWQQEGKTLAGGGSLSLSGTMKIPAGESLGTIECPTTATASLEAGKSGSLKEVAVSAAGCKVTGDIAPICTVSSVSPVSQPWSVSIGESAGKPVISTDAEVTFQVVFSGSECPSNWKFIGKLKMTPDSASAISSVALSGTFVTYIDAENKGVYSKFGVGRPVSGTLSASPAKKYGIGKPQQLVAVSGSLSWASPTYGSMTCGVSGTIALEPGSEGHFTEFKTTSCEFAGYIKSLCGTLPVTINSMPTVVDQGTSIAVKNVSISVWNGSCGFPPPFEGELQAVPDSTSAIAYTNLSGTLKTGATGIAWTGKLNWSPAGVYGL